MDQNLKFIFLIFFFVPIDHDLQNLFSHDFNLTSHCKSMDFLNKFFLKIQRFDYLVNCCKQILVAFCLYKIINDKRKHILFVKILLLYFITYVSKGDFFEKLFHLKVSHLLLLINSRKLFELSVVYS